ALADPYACYREEWCRPSSADSRASGNPANTSRANRPSTGPPLPRGRAGRLFLRRQTHARRRRNVVGHEEIHLQRLARIDAVLIEVGHALAGEERVVDQEVAGEALGFMEHAIGGLRQNLRLARHAHDRLTAEQVL